MRRIVLLALVVVACRGRSPLEIPAARDAGAAPARVDGRVIDQFGHGVSSLAVAVASRTAITDGDGRFSVADVRAPYRLAVVAAASNSVTVYDQLTTATPIVRIVVPAPTHVTVMTMIIDGSFWQASGTNLLTQWSGSSPSLVYYALSSGVGGLMPLLAQSTFMQQWEGADSGPVTIDFLQSDRTRDNGMPQVATGFHSFASGQAFVMSNSPSEVQLQPTPVATAMLTGTTRVPDGYTISQRSLALQQPFGVAYPYGARLEFTTEGSPGAGPPGLAAPFSYAYPLGTGLDLVFLVEARRADNSAGWVWLTNPTTPLAVTVPGAVDVAEPEDTAVGVTTATRFAWSPLAGAAYSVTFRLRTGMTLLVNTTATETTLPDLSVLGYAVPPSSLCGWTIGSFGPIATLDELVGPTWRSPAFTTASATRTFTTAP